MNRSLSSQGLVKDAATLAKIFKETPQVQVRYWERVGELLDANMAFDTNLVKELVAEAILQEASVKSMIGT